MCYQIKQIYLAPCSWISYEYLKFIHVYFTFLYYNKSSPFRIHRFKSHSWLIYCFVKLMKVFFFIWPIFVSPAMKGTEDETVIASQMSSFLWLGQFFIAITIQPRLTTFGPHIDNDVYMSVMHVSSDPDLIFMVYSLLSLLQIFVKGRWLSNISHWQLSLLSY